MPKSKSQSSTDFSISCAPRWATPRSPGRETRGGQVARIGELLGQPLMPWQRLVADVGCEVDSKTGLPAYREVIVTVPRQNGKTTIVLAFELERALLWPTFQRIAYTAQTGQDARKKLLDDQVPVIERSPIGSAIDRVMRAAGNESVWFKNGSRIEVLATTESAGHGKTIDLAILDETFADIDDRREQALLPAMTTRAAAQLVMVSTAGTDASAFLRRKVDAGRAAVEAGLTTGIAYFEWSAPDGANPDDPATWRACMPALGHTITEQVVAHARQTMTDGEFRRSYLNQWTRSDERVVPVESWEACAVEVAPSGRLTFGVAVHPDRSTSAIAVCDEQGRVELIEHRPGVGWVHDRLVDLVKRYDGHVVLEHYGPAGIVGNDLEQAKVPVVRLATRDVAQACSGLFDAIMEGRVQVRPHVGLDHAVASVRRKPTGNLWVWGRSDGTDICPLEAVTLAFDRARAPKSSEVWFAWR